jgi:hypothetical protein
VAAAFFLKIFQTEEEEMTESLQAAVLGWKPFALQTLFLAWLDSLSFFSLKELKEGHLAHFQYIQ